MTASLVGSRYARALVDVVLARGSNLNPAEVVEQLKTIEALIASSPDLNAVLLTPAVPPSRKKAVLGKLAEASGVSPLVRNFVNVVLDHKRIAQFAEIREAFEVLLDEALGIVRAEVASALPLDNAQSKAIEAELIRLSGKQVRIETTTDPNLVGGVVARIGSTVYDGSIRGQLEAMRRKFTTESADAALEI